MKFFFLVFTVVFVFALASAAAKTVTINNVIPRRDVNGRLMNIHDSSINRHRLGARYAGGGDFFVWAGASYPCCRYPLPLIPGCVWGEKTGDCGFSANNSVSVFISRDLVDWTPVGAAGGVVFEVAKFEKELGGPVILYCPKLIFCEQTGLWTLWFNAVSHQFKHSVYAVATAKHLEGPYEIAVPRVTTLGHASVGDFNLFIDEPHKAGYLIFTSHLLGNGSTHRMSVQRLTSDYQSTTGESSGFFGRHPVEAPALFRRRGFYYALFGHTCCYCPGTIVYAYSSSRSPLGPWTEQNAVDPGAPWGSPRLSRQAAALRGPAGRGGGGGRGDDERQLDQHAPERLGGGKLFTLAQQTTVFPFFDPSTNTTEFAWVGDRWQQAFDLEKCHDPVEFELLRWNDTAVPPRVIPFYFTDKFNISVDVMP